MNLFFRVIIFDQSEAYIDDQIACIQEILEKHLLGEKEECGMTKSEVYFYQKALASVLYTEDRIC